MTILKKHVKQPWEVKDYDIDYSAWLAESSPADTLTVVTGAITCISDPPNTTLVLDSVDVTDTRAKFMVSGGTHGSVYILTARATTLGVDGWVRKDESELQFTVKEVP